MFKTKYNEVLDKIKGTTVYKESVKQKMMQHIALIAEDPKGAVPRYKAIVYRGAPIAALAMCAMLIVGAYGLKANNIDNIKNAKKVSGEMRKTQGAMNPYKKSTDYIENKVSDVTVDGTTVKFEQIKDNMAAGLNFEDVTSACFTHDFHPDISKDNKVTFSRKNSGSDNDKTRFDKSIAFAGDKSKGLLSMLNNLSEHKMKTLDCNYCDMDGNVKAVVSFQKIFNNCSLSVYTMKDTSWIKDAAAKGFVESFKSSAENVKYVYQQRVYNPGKVTEEHYIYYGYYESGNYKYLLVFDSNYTASGSDKGAIEDIPVKSQQQCRETFCKILKNVVSKVK